MRWRSPPTPFSVHEQLDAAYLGQRFALSAALSGGVAADLPGDGVLSRVGSGLISDRLLGQRRVPVLQVAFLISLPLIVLSRWTRWLARIVVALIVAGFVIQLTFGVVYSYVREVVEAGITGTALAFLTTVGISGALIKWTDAYLSTFTSAAVLTAIGLLLSWVAPESPHSVVNRRQILIVHLFGDLYSHCRRRSSKAAPQRRQQPELTSSHVDRTDTSPILTNHICNLNPRLPRWILRYEHLEDFFRLPNQNDYPPYIRCLYYFNII